MSLVKCWYHYFLDRQASNNFAAYLFLSYIGSILATSWFQAGCHPPRAIEQDGMKISVVSQLFNISRNTIDLWLKRQAETGDYQALPASTSRQ
jgi:hypothetical protein